MAQGQQRLMGDSILDRVPPSSPEMEQQLVGSILLAPDLYDDVEYQIGLRQNHFFDDANSTIWAAISQIRNSGRPLDAALLIQTLKDNGDFELVGGIRYLSQVIGCVANGAHAIHYATAVKEKAQRRALIYACTTSLTEGYDSAATANHLIDQAESRLQAISDGDQQREVTGIREIMGVALDTINAREGGRNTGLRTGLCDLDDKLGGLRGSNVTILAARPGMGKTALALQIAMDTATGPPADQSARTASVLFFTLEMNPQELCERMLSSGSGVPLKPIRDGRLTGHQRSNLIQEAAEISQMHLSIEHDPGITAGRIASACRRHRRRTGFLDLVVIDYIQLIEPENSQDQRQEQVAKISRRLRLLAREMDIPVLALAQLNRDNEGTGKRPRMSNLRESGTLEQDASQVIMIHRPAYYNHELRPGGPHNYDPSEAEEAEMLIEKNRNGQTGIATVSWFADRTRFENRATPWQQDDFEPVTDRGGGDF